MTEARRWGAAAAGACISGPPICSPPAAWDLRGERGCEHSWARRRPSPSRVPKSSSRGGGSQDYTSPAHSRSGAKWCHQIGKGAPGRGGAGGAPPPPWRGNPARAPPASPVLLWVANLLGPLVMVYIMRPRQRRLNVGQGSGGANLQQQSPQKGKNTLQRGPPRAPLGMPRRAQKRIQAPRACCALALLLGTLPRGGGGGKGVPGRGSPAACCCCSARLRLALPRTAGGGAVRL